MAATKMNPACPVCNKPIVAEYRSYCKHIFKPFIVYYDYYVYPDYTFIGTEVYDSDNNGDIILNFDGFIKLDKEHIERLLLLK